MEKHAFDEQFESYVMAGGNSFLVSVVQPAMEKLEVISILLTLAWAGYKTLQCFYIKMAECEHLEELRRNRKENMADTSDLDQKIEELENEPPEYTEL